jgi:uncharacterized SAM-binding protein YcdF (DUF218 family)
VILRTLLKKKTRLVLLGVVLLFGVGNLVLYHEALFGGVADFIIYMDDPQPCDVICVLGGGTGERMEKGIELYQAGYAERLFVAFPEEIPADVPYQSLLQNEKRLKQALLDFYAVPPEAILWSTVPFYSTAEELQYIRNLLAERRYTSALIITGLYQSQRAKWAADRVFDASTTIVVVPAPAVDETREGWWRDMDCFVSVENEWLKNIYYFIRH